MLEFSAKFFLRFFLGIFKNFQRFFGKIFLEVLSEFFRVEKVVSPLLGRFLGLKKPSAGLGGILVIF